MRGAAHIVLGLVAGTLLGIPLASSLRQEPVTTSNELRPQLEEILRRLAELQSNADAARSTLMPEGPSPIEVPASPIALRVQEPPADSVELNPGPDVEHSLQRMFALLWRCTHGDRSDLVSRLAAVGLCPFDPGAPELLELAYSQLDELDSRTPAEVRNYRSSQAAVSDLEEQLARGNIPNEARSRIQDIVTRARQPENPQVAEYLEAKSRILREVDAELTRLSSR